MANITEKKIVRATTGNLDENFNMLASFVVKHISDKSYDNLENRIKFLQLCISVILQEKGIDKVKFQVNLDPSENDEVASYNKATNIIEVFIEPLENYKMDELISCVAHECEHIAQTKNLDAPKSIGESASSLKRKEVHNLSSTMELIGFLNSTYKTNFNVLHLALALYNNTPIEVGARKNQYTTVEEMLLLSKKCTKKYKSKISNYDEVLKTLDKMIDDNKIDRNDDASSTIILQKILKDNRKDLDQVIDKYQRDVASFIDGEVFANGRKDPQFTTSFMRSFEKFKESLTIHVNKQALSEVLSTLREADAPKLIAEILNIPNLEVSETQTAECALAIQEMYEKANVAMPPSIRNMITASVVKRYMEQNMININQEELTRSMQKARYAERAKTTAPVTKIQNVHEDFDELAN